MRKQFKHFTKEERDQIAVLQSRKESLRCIARRLGRSASSVLREIKRNQKQKVYLPHRAHERAEYRQRYAHPHKRLKSFALRHDIEQLIINKWSPEIIAGHLKRQEKAYACAESIYQWIYTDAPHLIGYLPRSHPRRRQRRFKRSRRVIIPGRISIQQRPAAVLARQQPRTLGSRSGGWLRHGRATSPGRADSSICPPQENSQQNRSRCSIRHQ